MSNENHTGDESVDNPGQNVDPEDQPKAVGNLGPTVRPEEELDQPKAIGNLGSTVHPEDELDQPQAIGNPGPRE